MQAIILSWMFALSTYGGTNYAAQMFETTSHDFGVVVKGSTTEYDFVFTNKYKEDVVIESVSSSCQCTTPSFSPRGPIHSWEKGRIRVSVNTKSFVGNKNATITVRFSKPIRMEVQLHSYVYIRSDVAVNPGIVYFGTVQEGNQPAVRVNISSVVPGGRWMIQDVRSDCKFVSVALKETERSYNRVSYVMTVMLKENAPPGPFSEVLEIITNDSDPRNSRLPVRIEGRVKKPLSVNPSPLSFGLVQEGRSVSRTLVLQAPENFNIRDITSENAYIRAEIKRDSKPIQQVLLSYEGTKPGNFSGTITIHTSLAENPSIDVNFSGKVNPKPRPVVTPEVATPETPKPETITPEVAKPEPTLPLAPPAETGLALPADADPIPEITGNEEPVRMPLIPLPEDLGSAPSTTPTNVPSEGKTESDEADAPEDFDSLLEIPADGDAPSDLDFPTDELGAPAEPEASEGAPETPIEGETPV
ncbi:MAG: DUF1573 domain-containing protein, partial [Planctomycetia bacterium]|nr:DUF1573 domain-containing protein [Planctomycetia bacterium]